MGKKGLSPIDAVSISARMNDLEDTLKKLCESFDKFKSDNQPTPATSFANVASHPLGAVQRTLQGQNVAGITRQGPLALSLLSISLDHLSKVGQM